MKPARFALCALSLTACASPAVTVEHDAGPDAGASLYLETPPDPVCRTPSAWNRDRALFDGAPATNAAWGLDTVRGFNLGVADIDGDQYPDLVVMTAGANQRTDDTATPPVLATRVLLNRPRADGPGRRFVEATRDSNFLVRTDGSWGRQTNLVAFADLDDDGDVDAYTGTYITVAGMPVPDDTGDRHAVLLNDGHGRFALAPDSIAQSTPYDAPQTEGITVLDADRDGRIDLWAGYSYDPSSNIEIGEQPNLFIGHGDGTFTDGTMAAGIGLARTMASFATGGQIRPLYGASACDLDGDGTTDLLGMAYGRQWNEVFVGSGTPGHYRDASLGSGLEGDADQDYTLDQSYWCYCVSNPTACPANTPAPQYTCPLRGWRVGYNDQPWRLNGNTFTLACGDVDNDGDLDVYSAEIAHPDTGPASDRSQLIVNESRPGTVHFTRPDRTALGLVPPSGTDNDEGGISAAMWDVDMDGRLDIWLGASDYERQFGWLFHQKTDGTYEEVGSVAGFHHACPHGVALADFDLDGDVDVVLGTSLARTCSATWHGQAEVHMYESTANTANWTSVTLVGRGVGGANTTAIGARVRITAGGVTQTREVQTAWGNLAQNSEATVHAGLGTACAIDRIEVRWPDGMLSTETFTDVRANRRIEIRQGEGHVRYYR